MSGLGEGLAPPPPTARGRGEARSRIAVLLDSRADERTLVAAASALCERHGASLRLVQVARSTAPPISLDLPVEWEAEAELQRREEQLLPNALREVPSDLDAETIRLSAAGIRSAAFRRSVQGAAAVVVACRCRPALVHRPWCRAARLARGLDVPVVAVKSLGAPARQGA